MILLFLLLLNQLSGHDRNPCPGFCDHDGGSTGVGVGVGNGVGSGSGSGDGC